jgi:hypothetical protein
VDMVDERYQDNNNINNDDDDDDLDLE